MEPVPVVKKRSNVWLWVIAVIAIVLIALWLMGAFDTRTVTTPGTPGADLRPLLEEPVAALGRFFA